MREEGGPVSWMDLCATRMLIRWVRSRTWDADADAVAPVLVLEGEEQSGPYYNLIASWSSYKRGIDLEH